MAKTDSRVLNDTEANNGHYAARYLVKEFEFIKSREKRLIHEKILDMRASILQILRPIKNIRVSVKGTYFYPDQTFIKMVRAKIIRFDMVKIQILFKGYSQLIVVNNCKAHEVIGVFEKEDFTFSKF